MKQREQLSTRGILEVVYKSCQELSKVFAECFVISLFYHVRAVSDDELSTAPDLVDQTL